MKNSAVYVLVLNIHKRIRIMYLKNVWKLAKFYAVFYTLYLLFITLQKPKEIFMTQLLLPLTRTTISNNGHVMHSFVISNVTRSVTVAISLLVVLTWNVFYAVFNIMIIIIQFLSEVSGLLKKKALINNKLFRYRTNIFLFESKSFLRCHFGLVWENWSKNDEIWAYFLYQYHLTSYTAEKNLHSFIRYFIN